MRVVFLVLAVSSLALSSTLHLMYVLDENRIFKFKDEGDGITIVEATLNILPILVKFDEICFGEKVELSKISKIDTRFGEMVFEMTDSENLESALDRMKFYYQMVNPVLNSIRFERVNLEERFVNSLERYRGFLDGDEILKILGFLKMFRDSPVDPRIERSVLSRDLKISSEYAEKVLKVFNEQLARLEDSNVRDSNIGNLIYGVETFCSMKKKLYEMERVLKCPDYSKCSLKVKGVPKVEKTADLLDLARYVIFRIAESDNESLGDLEALVRYTRSMIESELLKMELAWYDLKLILMELIERM